MLIHSEYIARRKRRLHPLCHVSSECHLLEYYTMLPCDCRRTKVQFYYFVKEKFIKYS